MKTNILFLVLTTILSSLFYGCGCKNCKDNLTTELKKIPYKDGELVAFKNDTLGVEYDTVKNPKTNSNWSLNTTTCPGNDAWNNQCTTFHNLDYSCYFSLQIVQGRNSENNKILYYAQTGEGQIYKTIKYEYKNEILNAYILYIPVDTFGSQMWKHYNFKNGDSNYVYNDYYYTTDKTIRLLQYTKVYRDGKRRVFRLQ